MSHCKWKESPAVSPERGYVLVSAMVGAMVLSGLLYSSSLVSVVELKESRRGLDEVRTLYLAQSGVEMATNRLKDAIRKTSYLDPFLGIKALFADGSGGYQTYLPFQSAPVLVGTTNAGEVTVSMQTEDRDGGMDITINSTGYFPAAPSNIPAGSPAPLSTTVQMTLRLELEPSRVFDNAYFVNNWGWFYGNTIYCNGNARSNGQFDAAYYHPTITGQPTYDGFQWVGEDADLLAYRDDNEDGLLDGTDGGTFSGWDIIRATNVKGNGGIAKNQHDFEGQIPMPNLSDLSLYESKAIAESGEIRIGTTLASNGVYGDESGEKGNLYLIGTVSDPVEISGTVVVRGDVIIAGIVKGKGAIYSGGNVYVANTLTYQDPPTTPRPTDNTEAATEAWITANQDKDMLGLFARENIVIGDHTHSWWQYYVSSWLGHSMNQSAEDSGEDLIPHTLEGRDGILGTADDDVLEGDGTFTIENYSPEDELLGLIPPGKMVGDPIPGSGEDIDGDGSYDGTISMFELDFKHALDQDHWGGNMPVGGIGNYSSVASIDIDRLDGLFYTNHAFAWLTVPSSPINVNGSIISRNESIIYGGPGLHMNYDCRLLGGNQGMAGDFLPKTMAPIETLSWSILDWDANSAYGS